MKVVSGVELTSCFTSLLRLEPTIDYSETDCKLSFSFCCDNFPGENLGILHSFILTTRF